MKVKHLFWGAILLVILPACSEERGAATAENPVPSAIEASQDLGETPPVLKVEVDGIEISSIRSGYNWSYFDEQENEWALVETETLSPMEAAEKQKAPRVDGETEIGLRFEKEPDSYRVNIWNSDGVVKGPYKGVVLDQASGKTVYVVTAIWEQGTDCYVFSLTVE